MQIAKLGLPKLQWSVNKNSVRERKKIEIKTSLSFSATRIRFWTNFMFYQDTSYVEQEKLICTYIDNTYICKSKLG